MKNNNQVIIEKDMHCPYCNEDSAVLISETVKTKKIIGCAPVGIVNGCLLYVTGGCWAIVNGYPLFDVKTETHTNLYGFCPCCGNTYIVNKPDQMDKLEHGTNNIKNMADKAKRFIDTAQNYNNNR